MSREESKTYPVPISEAYTELGLNAGVKTGIGFTVAFAASMLLFRKRMPRSLISGVGAGTGLGYALKEADEYFKNPSKDNLHRVHQMSQCLSNCCSSCKNSCLSFLPRK